MAAVEIVAAVYIENYEVVGDIAVAWSAGLIVFPQGSGRQGACHFMQASFFRT